MSDKRPFHVLLMRHGRHGSLPFDGSKPVLTPDGQKETIGVAKALYGFLEESKGLPQLKLDVGRILYADTAEAKETAELLKKCAWPGGDVMLKECTILNPAATSPYGPSSSLTPLLDGVARRAQRKSSRNTVILVGHQPLLGWIAEKLTGHAYPISRSEILCLSFKMPNPSNRLWNWIVTKVCKPLRAGKLRWALSPTDDETMAELKEKIRAKMEGAKLLGAFITTVLGFLLSTVVDEKKFPQEIEFQIGFYVSATCFFLAVAFYFAAYFAYDRLLMPRRFWSERARRKGRRQPSWLVMRPPSSALWVLYQNMMHVWNRLFTPATWLVFAGLISLAYGVFRPPWPWGAGLGLAVIGATLLSFPIYRAFLGPRIGSDD